MSEAPDDDLAGLPPLGTVVAGRYRMDSVIGAGGMGLVVRATHVHLGEPVALKFLRVAALENEALVERFLREARASVRIRSEHVARVFDVGTMPSGEPYMVMELLEGEDLNKVGRQRGPLPVADAVEYVLQACKALVEAHHLGIVHRDLKPANLFLTHRSDGSPLVKVLDFGISKVLDNQNQALTTTADVLGSPLYMSPEQIRDARRVDGRSDIWSLGAILYRLLTGRAAFAAESPAASLARIITDDPPRIRTLRPDACEEIEAVVARCLDKAPDARFQKVEALSAALAKALVAQAAAAAARESPPSAASATNSSGAGFRLGGSALGTPLRKAPGAPDDLPGSSEPTGPTRVRPPPRRAPTPVTDADGAATVLAPSHGGLSSSRGVANVTADGPVEEETDSSDETLVMVEATATPSSEPTRVRDLAPRPAPTRSSPDARPAPPLAAPVSAAGSGYADGGRGMTQRLVDPRLASHPNAQRTSPLEPLSGAPAQALPAPARPPPSPRIPARLDPGEETMAPFRRWGSSLAAYGSRRVLVVAVVVCFTLGALLALLAFR